ncbi:MAG: hypothetical protein ACOYJ1_17215 [Peptococcales bacterium]|jgi:hypothetical protein
MKRVLILVMVIIVCIVVCVSCAAESTGGSNKNDTPNVNKKQEAETPQKRKVSESEIKKIVESAFLESLIEHLEFYSNKKYSDYDINATKVKLGLFKKQSGVKKQIGDRFELNGTLYFYDKYGSLKDTGTFTYHIYVDEYGETSFGGFTSVHIVIK